MFCLRPKAYYIDERPIAYLASLITIRIGVSKSKFVRWK